MAEKFRVDLHLHSPKSVPNGDKVSWLDNDRDVLVTLARKGVRIIAFSDHNTFNYRWYKKMVEMGGDHFLILPAIEMNIYRPNGKNEDDVGNLIYVFSDELSASELIQIEAIMRKINKSGISAERAGTIFEQYEHLKIPHIGKDDYMTMEELSRMGTSIDAAEATSLSHPNYRKWLKDNGDASTVAFSDTHVWKKYPQQSTLYTEIEMENMSFNSLKKALKMNVNFAKESK